jgi:hypothetical protein
MCTINNPMHKTMIGAYCRRLARLRGADTAHAYGSVATCAPPRSVVVRASGGHRCRTRLRWRRRLVRLWYPLSPLPRRRGRRCRSRLRWPSSRVPSGNTVVRASMGLGHRRSCIVVGASPLKNEILALWNFFYRRPGNDVAEPDALLNRTSLWIVVGPHVVTSSCS